MKKIFISLFLSIFFFNNNAIAFEDFFIFGLRLQENEYELVPKIEKKFNVKVPVVSIIYDDFNSGEIIKLSNTFKTLGNERIFHISVNPFGFNLTELINDKKHKGWEKKYRNLFRIIKKYDAKVIFRSLHEMNGGWYSWSSDPENFKIFWKMMWTWSREEGLDRSNILFDMSVNSQDLPAEDPSDIRQGGSVITCNQTKKIEIGCHTFEDYYPGDEYVDLLGVTIYNWGTGARKEDWAKWRDPMTVINEPGYNTFDRMKKIGKPIFIDEAGTTSIKIEGPYDELKLIDIYKQYHTPDLGVTATGTIVKNNWIKKLPSIYTDSQVIGGAYFNADVTYGLNDRRQIGELDWTAIDPDRNFAYPAIINLLNDNRNLTYPTFYFNLSEKVFKSRIWPSDDEMILLHDYVSKYMFYKEGDLIMNDTSMDITNKNAKYMIYLEKRLASNPYLCEHISKKFTKMTCDLKNFKKNKFIQNAFDNLVYRIDKSNVRLSNWGIWEQIEFLKVAYSYKSNINVKNKSVITGYLNDYEKNYLDLR